jgi:hypothetical protein
MRKTKLICIKNSKRSKQAGGDEVLRYGERTINESVETWLPRV